MENTVAAVRRQQAVIHRMDKEVPGTAKGERGIAALKGDYSTAADIGNGDQLAAVNGNVLALNLLNLLLAIAVIRTQSSTGNEGAAEESSFGCSSRPAFSAPDIEDFFCTRTATSPL